MRRNLLRAVVLLACVVAINCGKSDPTNPDPATPPGGSGGTGGGGGGGGTPTGQTALVSDDTFNDNDWDETVQVFGAGGSGGAGQLHFNGQATAGYRQVTITVNTADNGSAAQVAVFSIKRGSQYFPTSDGKIFTINYSEDSILQAGGGNGQYSAPAVRQNGKLYTLVPGAGAFATPDAAWTSHSLTGLTQNDFRTIASASEHPDFSATGARMELGFMRLHTVAAGGAGGTRTGGIDNLRLTLNR